MDTNIPLSSFPKQWKGQIFQITLLGIRFEQNPTGLLILSLFWSYTAVHLLHAILKKGTFFIVKAISEVLRLEAVHLVSIKGKDICPIHILFLSFLCGQSDLDNLR